LGVRLFSSLRCPLELSFHLIAVVQFRSVLAWTILIKAFFPFFLPLPPLYSGALSSISHQGFSRKLSPTPPSIQIRVIFPKSPQFLVISPKPPLLPLVSYNVVRFWTTFPTLLQMWFQFSPTAPPLFFVGSQQIYWDPMIFFFQRWLPLLHQTRRFLKNPPLAAPPFSPVQRTFSPILRSAWLFFFFVSSFRKSRMGSLVLWFPQDPLLEVLLCELDFFLVFHVRSPTSPPPPSSLRLREVVQLPNSCSPGCLP